ncbi:unnamed protein product [Protopolystoma xenopodis]|uniref:Peptidase M16 N-terminal domain-containing protein n=1 Tax=Protopolystoma xenopodis TaxID=117903 RepID=A0A448WX21_9PLAT|nr:unnamed protein product [Protopolystoma xenopodis]
MLVSVENPNGAYKGLVRIVGLFDAGSRYEKDLESRGITHLLRRSCGLSTKELTQVNLTRHLNQMGASLRCATSREHLIFSIDAPSCFAHRAAQLLATTATQTLFFHWELKDVVYPLMEYDVEVLSRRRLDAPTFFLFLNLCLTVASELLHEAAFGTHPSGTGLGNSLYAPKSMLTWFTEDAISSFTSSYLRPDRLVLAVVGHHNGQELLQSTTKHIDLLDTNPSNTSKEHKEDSKPHGFVGGNIAYFFQVAYVWTIIKLINHLLLAWPTSGNKDLKNHLSLAVISRALSGSAGRISHTTTAYSGNRLNSSFGESPEIDSLAMASGLYESYTDHGIFGFAVTAKCGKALARRAQHCAKVIHKTLGDEEVLRGKALLKADLSIGFESSLSLANDLALQIARNESNTYLQPDQLLSSIEKLTTQDINQAMKKVLSSPKTAMSVVGSNTHLVPHRSILLSS